MPFPKAVALVFTFSIGRIRKLTTREVFNFQGFPPTYDISNVSDSALYKLAGNCITVRVGAMVLERVVAALRADLDTAPVQGENTGANTERVVAALKT